jgi:hypothetical protein
VTWRGWLWVTAKPTFSVGKKDEMGKKKKWKEEEEVDRKREMGEKKQWKEEEEVGREEEMGEKKKWKEEEEISVRIHCSMV